MDLKIGIQLIIPYDCYLWCQMWYQKWQNYLKLQSETINALQVWLCSWRTFNHARKLNMGIQLNNDIWWLFVMSNMIPKMTKSSKTAARNHQCPPSMTVFLTHFYSWSPDIVPQISQNFTTLSWTSKRPLQLPTPATRSLPGPGLVKLRAVHVCLLVEGAAPEKKPLLVYAMS